MDHHLGILQKRIQSAALGNPCHMHRARSIGACKDVKRARHENVENQKENLDAGQRHSHVGHQPGCFLRFRKSAQNA